MTRAEVLRILRTTPDRIAALVDRLAPSRDADTSGADEWSVSQIIDHLCLGERDLILPRLQQMHRENGPVFPSSTVSRTGFAAVPQGGDAAERLDAFRRARQETLAFLDTLTDADWYRVGTTPTRGTLTIEAYARYLAEHDLEHLAQLEASRNTNAGSVEELSCTICDIVAGRLPARIVYSDDAAIAFFPRDPAVRGHTVIAPRTHSGDLSDTSDHVLGRLLQVAKGLTDHYKARLGIEGANLLMASGSVAQQSIPHVHLHLIPRVTGDGLDAWPQFPTIEIPDPDVLLDLLRLPDHPNLPRASRPSE